MLQVEALLDRIDGKAPVVDFVTNRLEKLGYGSWAQRVINTAGRQSSSRLASFQLCLQLLLFSPFGRCSMGSKT